MLITFEGIDGSGKTSQAKTLEAYLTAHGYKVSLFHEPGKTGKLKPLREMILSGEYAPKAALYMFLAARDQLIEENLEAFQDPEHVVLIDRYYHSTIAYQSLAVPQFEGRITHELIAMAKESTRGFYPNLVLYLAIRPEVSDLRLDGRQASLPGAGLNHFDRWDAEKKRALTQNYGLAFRLTLDNVKVINGEQSEEAVKLAILKEVEPYLPIIDSEAI